MKYYFNSELNTNLHAKTHLHTRLFLLIHLNGSFTYIS